MDNEIKNKKLKLAVATAVALAATIDPVVEAQAARTVTANTCSCGTSCTGACTGNCRGTCSGSRTGRTDCSCGTSCAGACTGNCRGSCSGCTGTCSGCTGCTSCSGNCSGCTGCSGNCAGTCSGSCTGCTSCSGNCTGCTSCSSCSGTCSGSCSSCSGTCSGCSSCSGSCTSCSSCSGCSGTCSGSCSGCSGTCSGCSGTCSGSALGKYTITFNNQGATSAGTTSITATVGSAMPTITVPKKTNYDFMGYYTSTDGGGTQYYTASGASARTWDKSAATTLYAYWKMSACNVTYNANGGSVSPATKAIPLNTTYGTLPTPTRAGYAFLGWFTDSSGGTKVTSSTTVPTASSTTIYAHWQANTNTAYKVKHYQMKVTGSGYDLVDTDNYTGTTDTNVTPAVKTYEGFTSPAKQTKKIAGDGSLVVEYYYERNKYKVTINAGTGVDSTPVTEEYYYGQEVNLSRKPKKGYNFKHFRTDKDIKAKGKH